MMAGDGDSPFTSSREGIVETDPNFQALMDYLKKELIPRIIDQWDEFRLARGEDGDEENPRETKKQRKAAGLVAAAEQEFTDDLPPEQGDIVESWISQMRPDAKFNLEAYIDCFLSENLVRKYLVHSNTALTPNAQKKADGWKISEAQRKLDANINFDIRRDNIELSYLSMDELAVCAEGAKAKAGKVTPMVQSAIAFKPVRNAVGHTGLLTDVAKNHLNVTFHNIKGRLKTMLQNMKP
jgi:hypothetical protein